MTMVLLRHAAEKSGAMLGSIIGLSVILLSQRFVSDFDFSFPNFSVYQLLIKNVRHRRPI